MPTVEPRPDAPIPQRLIDLVPADLLDEGADLIAAFAPVTAVLEPLCERFEAYMERAERIEHELMAGIGTGETGVTEADALTTVAALVTGSQAVHNAMSAAYELLAQLV